MLLEKTRRGVEDRARQASSTARVPSRLTARARSKSSSQLGADHGGQVEDRHVIAVDHVAQPARIGDVPDHPVDTVVRFPGVDRAGGVEKDNAVDHLWPAGRTSQSGALEQATGEDATQKAGASGDDHTHEATLG